MLPDGVFLGMATVKVLPWFPAAGVFQGRSLLLRVGGREGRVAGLVRASPAHRDLEAMACGNGLG